MRMRSKIVLGIAALALLAGIAVKTQQARIGAALFGN
jgi:hypothetical protein